MIRWNPGENPASSGEVARIDHVKEWLKKRSGIPGERSVFAQITCGNLSSEISLWFLSNWTDSISKVNLSRHFLQETRFPFIYHCTHPCFLANTSLHTCPVMWPFPLLLCSNHLSLSKTPGPIMGHSLTWTSCLHLQGHAGHTFPVFKSLFSNPTCSVSFT